MDSGTRIDEHQDDLETARVLLEAGNFPQAELYLRRYQRFGGQNPLAQHLLAEVARGYGVDEGFRLHEGRARPADAPPRYLLIKAWGYGFWSEVHHVMGQLLLAELTQRTPIVHWGTNSLFREGDDPRANAYTQFFEPSSPVAVDDLPQTLTIYPPKWTRDNLLEDNVNKWEGPHSRMAAQLLFDRDEALVVSDFYTTVDALIPWIAAGSRYFGLDENGVYSALFAHYLCPAAAIRERVAAFQQGHMAGRQWVGAHVRGSDKVFESGALREINQRYFGFIDRIITLNPAIGVFLLTDSVDIHAEFRARYGERLLTTPALRSSTSTGVHMQGHSGRTVGEEVLVDALLGAGCDYFVGNQESNVSLAIASMKPWRQGLLFMLGDHNFRGENPYLHHREKRTFLTCRLCSAPTNHLFTRRRAGTQDVAYHRCTVCSALQSDTPTWLEDARTQARARDTGQAARALRHAATLPGLFEALGIRATDLAVDLGNGSALTGRLLRDAGYNFHVCDVQGDRSAMQGFTWEALEHPCRVLTLLEGLDADANPAATWQRVLACDPDWIIGSTPLYAAQGADWPELAAESGERVFFYSADTLAHVARSAGRNAYHLGPYFLIGREALDDAAIQTVNTWLGGAGEATSRALTRWLEPAQARAGADHAWVAACQRLQHSGWRIAVDGTFFRYATGIARVWKSLLAHWAASCLASSLLVIDRGHTAPRLPGLHYVDAPLYDYALAEQDRDMLQQICDREQVGLFISTYYTVPRSTPSVLLVHDMIPEAMGYDLTNPQWVGKHQAIAQASAYLSISHSTDRDLVRYCPYTAQRPRVVVPNGCDFRPATQARIADFRARHGITRPYFLLSGVRDGPKNAILFFQAFALLGAQRAQFAILCTNAVRPLEALPAELAGEAEVHMLVLSDADLQCAYSGALALAYPSRYEGFGLPVVEAMACGCPVITCANSALPEVGGDAALYVDPDRVDEMHQALRTVTDPDQRAGLVARGRAQAGQFAWARMAREAGLHLATWAHAARARS